MSNGTSLAEEIKKAKKNIWDLEDEERKLRAEIRGVRDRQLQLESQARGLKDELRALRCKTVDLTDRKISERRNIVRLREELRRRINQTVQSDVDSEYQAIMAENAEQMKAAGLS